MATEYGFAVANASVFLAHLRKAFAELVLLCIAVTNSLLNGILAFSEIV